MRHYRLVADEMPCRIPVTRLSVLMCSTIPSDTIFTGMRNFDVVIERDEEGLYIGSVPQLPGCHTQGTSLDELMGRMREALELCLDVEGNTSNSLEFVGIQRITIAA